MFAAIGIVVLLVLVFGGFVLAGGALGPVLAALPLEFMMIGGAAVGATLIGNSMHEIKLLGGGLGRVFKGPRYNDQDHIDVIALTSKLMKLLRSEGAVALESHVTEPASSTLFSEYPRLQADAVVTGIIKTMGAIDKPPEILGHMIGSALVGTFLGVLLAYGFAGPLGGRLKQINTHDQQIFHSIKQVIIASLHGYPQPLVLEAARSGLPPAHRPKLTDLLDMMRGR